MRSRSASDAHLAEVARRRLEQLSAEIAGTRPGHPSSPLVGEGPGDLPVRERVPAVGPRGGGRHALRTGQARLIAGWAQDRMPPSLQGRVRLGPAHLAVVATLLAVGLALAALWVLHTDDSSSLVPVSQHAPETPLVTPARAGPAASAASSQPQDGSGLVVVDVAGKVRRPGIATLPAGSRVIDALKAAGGVRPGVDLSSLNRARPLVDGEQILVGEPLPGGAAASAASSVGSAGAGTGGGPLVSLNTADQATLESLPGVGPVTATSIIEWRDENGGFRSVDELLEVSGIGDATLARLAPLVTL
jgi:competence protein ComEA